MNETPVQTGTDRALNIVKVVITVGGAVLGILNVALELALKIKAFFAATNPEISVSIEDFNGQAAKADEETLGRANAWLEAQGLPTVNAPTA